MNITDLFNHAVDCVKAQIYSYLVTILFVAVVIFAFMLTSQSSDFIGGFLDKNFEQVGSNIIRISSAVSSNNDSIELSMKDVNLLLNEANQDLDGVYGIIQRNAEVYVSLVTSPIIVRGVTSEFDKFYPIEILQGGKFVDNNDISLLKKVVVVNNTFAEKYFKKIDIVGQTLVLKNSKGEKEKFDIIGVMKNEGYLKTNPFRNDAVDEIYIPLTVSSRFFDTKTIDYVEVRVSRSDLIDTVSERIAKLLEFKHGNGSSFVVTQRKDILNTKKELAVLSSRILTSFQIVLMIMAFVGIVNAINILIEKRVNEFALRKMMGASKKHIFMQIELETIVITGIGGIIGIVIGIIFGYVLDWQFGYANSINIVSAIPSLILVLLLSATAAVFPAKRASQICVSSYTRHE